MPLIFKLTNFSPFREVDLLTPGAKDAFCFTSYVVMLAFWSPSTAGGFAFRFTICD